MPTPNRIDTSPIGTWKRNSDLLTLTCAFILLFIGYILVIAASPSVALRIGASHSIFIVKQMFFLGLSAITIFCIALCPRKVILRIAIAGNIVTILLVILALLHGTEIKGARRWIDLPFFSFQPSEFLKPCFAVVTGYLLTRTTMQQQRLGRIFNWLLWAVIIALLKLQPDVGMLTVITVVFFSQNFMCGMSGRKFLTISSALAVLGAWILISSPHARTRIAEYWHGSNSEHYQIDMSLRAFGHGGLTGQGLGEGKVKNFIPDAHADFIFSVAGEECGAFLCLFIILLYGTIIYSTLRRLKEIRDPFVIVATTGLVVGFGLQACINMASTLALMPTKGMTLPFISYGGSSDISIAIVIGMIIALTRKQPEDYASN